MANNAFLFFFISMLYYWSIYTKHQEWQEHAIFYFHKMENIFQPFMMHMYWYNAPVRLCIKMQWCVLFDKARRYHTCFVSWRFVTYLYNNILIAFVFNSSGYLLIKLHGMSSMNKNFSQRDGSTFRITKKTIGST